MGVLEWQDEKTVRDLDTSPGRCTKTLLHTVHFMEIVSEMSTLCSKLFRSTDNEHDSS